MNALIKNIFNESIWSYNMIDDDIYSSIRLSNNEHS